MANVLVNETSLTNIANAIRSKNGTQTTYKPDEMSTAISNIPTGSSHNWSQIGYSDEPEFIDDGFEHGKTIYNNWDPSVITVRELFKDDLDLIFMPLVNTANVTDFHSMFLGCYHLINVPVLNTSNGTLFSNMFYNCYSLCDAPLLNTSNGTLFSNMFYNCHGLPEIPLLNTSKGTHFSYMFYGCSTLSSIPQLDVSTGNYFDYMFYNCINLTSIPLLDLSGGTTFNNMFYNCNKMTTLPSLNTSNGTNFGYMFYNCTKMTTVPLLNLSKATNVSGMFSSCSSLVALGGFSNLGQSYSTSQPANATAYTFNISASSNLTEQSLINVLTNLYDIATKGCNAQKCTIGATNLAKLTSAAGQAALTQAQNYGWTIS